MAHESPLPQRLSEARKRIGISQRELGIRLGMEPSSASSRMNHYEKGRHSPDYPTLKRISQELEVPVAYFYAEDSETAELYRVISTLDSSKRDKLNTMLD